MDPGAGEAFVLLSRFVGALPISLGIPPKAREREVQFTRWLIAGKGVVEFLKGH